MAISQVLAISILTFSNRLGLFVPICLSKMKPGTAYQVSDRALSGCFDIDTFIEVRVRQFAADLLDDLDVLEVGGTLSCDGVSAFGWWGCSWSQTCRRRTASTARFAKV